MVETIVLSNSRLVMFTLFHVDIQLVMHFKVIQFRARNTNLLQHLLYLYQQLQLHLYRLLHLTQPLQESFAVNEVVFVEEPMFVFRSHRWPNTTMHHFLYKPVALHKKIYALHTLITQHNRQFIL